VDSKPGLSVVPSDRHGVSASDLQTKTSRSPTGKGVSFWNAVAWRHNTNPQAAQNRPWQSANTKGFPHLACLLRLYTWIVIFDEISFQLQPKN